ncbi:MAG: carotenoid oxygenase family protein [Actinomycetota bacterium]
MSATDTLTTTVVNAANQPDLRGNLAPVGDELDIAHCEIEGRVPDGLRGQFVRNGPNPAFEPLGSYHMFDGDGMLHGVTFTDDGVSYRNRWIRSKGLRAEIANGRAVYSGLGEVMDFPDPELVGDAGPVKNPANTHIIEHADRWLALWEGGLPTEVTEDLETVGEFDFDGLLRGSMTAHPRIDPRTGELLFFAYSVTDPVIRYYVADASGALVHKAKLPVPAPIMMHDFIITEDHAVFLDSPIVFNVENLGKGPLVNWEPDNGTRIGVMPRLGGPDDIRWFEIEPGHVQHFWNGWAEGNRIEFTGSRFVAPDFGIDPTAPLDEQSADNEPGTAARFWVDLDSGEAGWESLDDLPGDFCRFNDDYNGVPSRYAYLSAFGGDLGDRGDFDTIAKYDQQSGERTLWRSGSDGHVGESVFAPDPAGTEEDDGWLINAVHYSDTDHTDVCVLDARDVEAGPIARVRMPRRIPFGFHANWFAAR